MKIELIHLLELCVKFKVTFSIEPDTERNTYVYYCLGPIRWAKQATDSFTIEDYFEISMRLAATYPEKVLPTK